MRFNVKVDANQTEIVNALRKAGATVTSTAAIGKGFPDLAVGFKGLTYLLEIKDGKRIKSDRELTKHEKEWHEKWRGHAAVVENIEEALNVIGVNYVS